MKKLIISVILISFSNCFYSQIEIQINKLGKDSLDVKVCNNGELEMNKVYNFIVKTNIVEDDSLILNLYHDTNQFIKNDLSFNTSFNECTYEIIITKRTSSNSRRIIFENDFLMLKGAKFILLIDGVEYSKYKGGSIFENSKVEIELLSDLYKLEDIEVRDPVIFTWNKRLQYRDSLYLETYKCSAKLNKLKKS